MWLARTSFARSQLVYCIHLIDHRREISCMLKVLFLHRHTMRAKCFPQAHQRSDPRFGQGEVILDFRARSLQIIFDLVYGEQFRPNTQVGRLSSRNLVHGETVKELDSYFLLGAPLHPLPMQNFDLTANTVIVS